MGYITMVRSFDLTLARCQRCGADDRWESPRSGSLPVDYEAYLKQLEKERIVVLAFKEKHVSCQLSKAMAARALQQTAFSIATGDANGTPRNVTAEGVDELQRAIDDWRNAPDATAVALVANRTDIEAP